MSHFVRLEVVVDAERPELCGRDCEHGGFKICHLFDEVRLGHDGPREEGWVVWKRTGSCLKATALDEKERNVIKAAEIMARDIVELHGRGITERSWERGIVAAVHALSALRAEGKRDDT